MPIRWRTFITFAAFARWSRTACSSKAHRYGRAWASNRNALIENSQTVGLSFQGDLFQGLLQRRLVGDVDTLLRTVDLAHQPAEHFPRTKLDERVHALRDQQAHRLLPLYRSCHLSNQGTAAAICIFEQFCVDVADNSDCGLRERD